jgi:hypothetical protein
MSTRSQQPSFGGRAHCKMTGTGEACVPSASQVTNTCLVFELPHGQFSVLTAIVDQSPAGPMSTPVTLLVHDEPIVSVPVHPVTVPLIRICPGMPGPTKTAPAGVTPTNSVIVTEIVMALARSEERCAA